MFWKKAKKSENQKATDQQPPKAPGSSAKNVVLSPCEGRIGKLEELNDGVFSAKMMGDGVVIIPNDSAKKLEFFAPIAGELVTVFPTKHAFGIRSEEGLEVLLHIGIDTVNLEGKGFEIFVKQGQRVEQGEKLVVVDIAHVRKNAPSADAILIVTSGQRVAKVADNKVMPHEFLFQV